MDSVYTTSTVMGMGDIHIWCSAGGLNGNGFISSQCDYKYHMVLIHSARTAHPGADGGVDDNLRDICIS